VTAFGVACIPASPLLLARLRDAVGQPDRVRHFPDAASALPHIISGSIDATVVAVFAGEIDQALNTIRLLRETVPTHAVLAWCELRALSTRQLLDIAQSGVAELVLRDVDDMRHVLARVLTSATQRSVVQRIEAKFSAMVPHALQPLFRYALEHAHEPLTVDGVAATFGVTRRTLRNRLVDHSMPRPRHFLTWCRLLVAAALLDERGRSLDSVAEQLDFSSGAGLGMMLRRYAGSGITSLRDHHVSSVVEAAFRNASSFAAPPLLTASIAPLASLPLHSSTD